MQVINHDYYIDLAKRNRVRIIRVPASRGKIFDRNGVLLVDSRAATQLIVSADEIDNRDFVVNELSSLTGFKPDYIMKKIKDSVFKPFIPAVLAQDMDEEMLVKVSEAKPRLCGVSIKINPVRDYLFGKAMSHIIGYVGQVTQKDLDKGYKWDDIIGKDGIEKVLDAELQGKMGFKEMQVDNKGNVDKVLKFIKPEQGNDLYLTIDSRLQKVLYESFGKYSGAGIVINPKTGEVLAMVSVPGYEPSAFISPAKTEVISGIFCDKRKPLLNRTIAGLYSPGSVFKIIVALAALEELDQKLEEKLLFCDGKFNLGDSLFKCWGKHNWVDLGNALKKSCNEYFYQIGLKTGSGVIVSMAKRFGLGKKTGVELLGEKNGLLPDTGMEWYPGDTVNLSIGHGNILVTPIQIACLVCAVANMGTYYKPVLVMGQKPEVIEIEVGKEKIDLVRKSLLRVVCESSGTGHRAYMKGLDIAGKTGTVELAENKIFTWFVGFAPFYNSEIVVVVVTEGGESGGTTAAPVAKNVFKEWLNIDPHTNKKI